MNEPTVGSLFSGIGGIDLAFERAGFRIVFQVEIDEYCTRILEQHWPDVARYRDVKECGSRNLPAVDVLAGGFPCQDISNAGKKAGIKEGTRSGLWIEFARIIGEIRPAVVLLENVAAITSRDGIKVISDLTEMGYDAEWGIIPASAVGAPHERKRWFCVAYRNGLRQLQPEGDVAAIGGWPEYSRTELGDAERSGRSWVARRGAGSQPADGHSRPEQSSEAARNTRSSLHGSLELAHAPSSGRKALNSGATAGEEARQRRLDGSSQSDLGDAAGEGLSQSRQPRLATPETESRAGLDAQPERSGELGNAESFGVQGDRAARLEVAGTQLEQGLYGRASAGSGWEDRPTQSIFCRAVDGLSRQLDCSRWPAYRGEAQKAWEAPRIAYDVPNRVARIRALGNAVVPQVVQPIAEAIYEFLCEIDEAEANGN